MYDYLVLGSSGFIGSNFCNYLKSRSFNFKGVSRSDNTSELFLDNKFINLPDSKITIYIAETNDIRQANSMGEEFINLNVTRLRSALESSIKSSFVYFSSASVYGDKKIGNRSTHESLTPSSVYTESKLKCEELALSYGALVLRAGNIFGPNMQAKNIFTDIINQIHNDVILINDLKPIRDFIYIDDVNYFLGNLYDNFSSGLYNLASGLGTSIDDVVKLTLRCVGKDIRVNQITENSPPSTIILNIDETKTKFNWEPKISFEEAVKILINKK
tara:strand:+ start:9817 stop:10635 length:819 start_codon:yes stop_codon:yes gene_type:complete